MNEWFPDSWNIHGTVVYDVLDGPDQQADHEQQIHDNVVVVPKCEISEKYVLNKCFLILITKYYKSTF